MNSVTDPIRTMFLAGVGTLALGAEKAEEALKVLVEKGQITVEQGKEIAADLQANTAEKTEELRDQIIKAQMQTMTKSQRDAFAARIAEIAAHVDEDEALSKQEQKEVKAASKK